MISSFGSSETWGLTGLRFLINAALQLLINARKSAG